jgi:hypothetical protein
MWHPQAVHYLQFQEACAKLLGDLEIYREVRKFRRENNFLATPESEQRMLEQAREELQKLGRL